MAIKLISNGPRTDMYTDNYGRPTVRLSNGAVYSLLYYDEARKSSTVSVSYSEYSYSGDKEYKAYANAGAVGNIGTAINYHTYTEGKVEKLSMYGMQTAVASGSTTYNLWANTEYTIIGVWYFWNN